ncbi:MULTISPECIES: amino acid ABC transporter ATP-binding protein [Roseobacteraceae]|uniref:amino acid ABC transporter ATP-binding protein n=1 Tax=Roseobacteraceae TaxID=2854170 RepID=UPI00329A737B
MREQMISVSGVDKFYGGFQALSHVTLGVKRGERVVICGPSGSGKSTLIRCFNGLEFHDAGSVVIDGIAVEQDSKSLHQLRQQVGMVFQQFNLFPHLTILENLTIGPMKVQKIGKKEAEARARTYLERVRIPEQAGKYPAQLSGGQQQRAAIARSLCMETQIILFDEPTSALDPEMIHEVLDVIVELADTGITMVCVTHEMGFARKVADTMVFMEDGKILEIAPPEKFFTDPDSDRCKAFLSQILEH